MPIRRRSALQEVSPPGSMSPLPSTPPLSNDQTTEVHAPPAQTSALKVEPHPKKLRQRVSSSRRWSKEEEEELKRLCEGRRDLRWGEIAAKFPGRTARSIETKYHNELKKADGSAGTTTLAVQTRVTRPIDNPLPTASTSASSNYSATPTDDLRTRFPFASAHYAFQPSPSLAPIPPLKPIRKGTRADWTPEEDDKLKKMCAGRKRHSWAMISEAFPSRSDRSCETRWNKDLKGQSEMVGPTAASQVGTTPTLSQPVELDANPEPQLKRWTLEEDALLRSWVLRPRDSSRVPWSEIAENFPHRSQSSLASRWQSIGRGGGDVSSADSDSLQQNLSSSLVPQKRRPHSKIITTSPTTQPVRATKRFAALATVCAASTNEMTGPSRITESPEYIEREYDDYGASFEPPSSPPNVVPPPSLSFAKAPKPPALRFRRAVSEPLMGRE
ncbi:hypothetical protein P7C70_g5108, partial [Phenoliferia sp. Uapishka_3]